MDIYNLLKNIKSFEIFTDISQIRDKLQTTTCIRNTIYMLKDQRKQCISYQYTKLSLFQILKHNNINKIERNLINSDTMYVTFPVISLPE